METEKHDKRFERPFGFLHIGKTGGTAVIAALRQHTELTGEKNVTYLGHGARLEKILEDHPGLKLCFVVRDPVSRFVSAFNSRMRGGRLGTKERKSREERVFDRFTTPNDLAEALSSNDDNMKRKAEKAMNVVGHLRRDLVHHLGSVDVLEAGKNQIVFIGEQKSLDEDFSRFKAIVGLRPDIELPTDQVGAHKAPDTMSKDLSRLAVQNIQRHYARDYPIYDWCLRQRDVIFARCSDEN